MSGSNSSGPVAAPAPDPVAMTVHSGPSPLLPAGERRRRGGRFTALLVLLACAAPVIVSYFTYYVWRPSGRNNAADLIQRTGNSVVVDPHFDWGDQQFTGTSFNKQVLYEMHIGTFNLAVPSTPGSFDAAIEKLDYLA